MNEEEPMNWKFMKQLRVGRNVDCLKKGLADEEAKKTDNAYDSNA